MMLMADASFREYLEYEDFTFYKENIRSIVYTIILPAIASILSLFAVFKILRVMQKGEDVITTNHPIRSVSFLFLVCIGVFFLYNLFHDSPPNLFPFNDPDATYSISVAPDSTLYVLRYTTTSDRNRSYNCSWNKNGNKDCRWEANNNISGVAIGKSPINLKKFVNKNVKINGEFAYATQQCIVTTCQKFPQRLVVNITAIETISSLK